MSLVNVSCDSVLHWPDSCSGCRWRNIHCSLWRYRKSSLWLIKSSGGQYSGSVSVSIVFLESYQHFQQGKSHASMFFCFVRGDAFSGEGPMSLQSSKRARRRTQGTTGRSASPPSWERWWSSLTWRSSTSKWRKRRLSGVVSMDSPRGNHAWPIL